MPSDVRDPKVLRHGEFWYMVLGAALGGSARGQATAALLYRSTNLRKWEYLGVFARSQGRFGTMWECRIFSAGQQWVLHLFPYVLRFQNHRLLGGRNGL